LGGAGFTGTKFSEKKALSISCRCSKKASGTAGGSWQSENRELKKRIEPLAGSAGLPPNKKFSPVMRFSCKRVAQ